MKNILNISKEELINTLGIQKNFIYEQIMDFVYKGKSYNEMSSISLELRNKLKELIPYIPVHIKTIQKSIDGTKKYLFELLDGNFIEAVFMPNAYGNTVCLSTQVGCRMGCRFCASTIGGRVRNLDYTEMLGQVIVLNSDNKQQSERSIKNIVLMGIGEPLDNYENTVEFIKEIITNRLNFSKRNISLSTCGLVEQIDRLIEENLGINLCISLHAPFDDIREKIMPINKKYKVSDILEACKRYYVATKRQIIFEYVMIKGINDTRACFDEIVKISKRMDCHFNFIILNKVEESEYRGTDKTEVYKFVESLNKLGVNATVRRSLGSDIDGACGQLRRKSLSK